MQTANSKREFVYLDTDVIDRERPNKTNVKTLVGTRKVHSLRNVGEPYLVQHRNLSCFYDGCMSDGACMNMAYVDLWDQVSLANKQVVTKETTATNQKITATKQKITATKQKTKTNSNNKGQRSEISKDQFVKVRIKGKRTSKEFVAQVIDTDMDEVHVSLMAFKTENLYIWPPPPETSWESRDSIVERTSNPVLSKESTNDRQLYFFE